MASCAAGKTFRVYGQYTSLVCKLMIKTWGYLFEANEKKNIKNTCEPSKIYFPFMWTLLQYIEYGIFSAARKMSEIVHK